MRLFITGANGFIGSYLANFFLKRKYNVVAAARYFHESTKDLLKGAELITFDLLDQDRLRQLVIKADVVVHTATANDIISKDTLKGIELSVIGTKNILEFAVANKIPSCIIFSTFQVYGTELEGEISEESPLLCQNDYGMNHLFAEMYAEMYSRIGKLKTVAVRPANVYGRIVTDAFDRWTLVPACFCKEAFEQGCITIKSSGKQMRNFVSLGNLGNAINCILGRFPDGYECYNLASTKGFTMLEVAEIVKKVYEEQFKKPLQINITGTYPVKTNNFSVNISKLSAIGFNEDEKYSFETEIKEIFSYLKLKN